MLRAKQAARTISMTPSTGPEKRQKNSTNQMGCEGSRHSGCMNASVRTFSLSSTALAFLSVLAAAAAGCGATQNAPSDTDSEELRRSRCVNKACGADCTPRGSDEPFNCNAAHQCVAAGADLGCSPPKCAGKACGADCSNPGDDEPSFCNSAGKCVSTGTPITCPPPPPPPPPGKCAGKACGVDCSSPGDDEPSSCDGFGKCISTGTPVSCPPPAAACTGKACGTDCSPAGSDEPFNCDINGQCVATGTPVHCAPPTCPEFLGDCIAGQEPVDKDGDGCIDGCGPKK